MYDEAHRREEKEKCRARDMPPAMQMMGIDMGSVIPER